MKRVFSGVLKQFDVSVENRAGALAEICEVFAESAINIRAIATSDFEDGKGTLRIITENENTTLDILNKSNLNFKTHDILNLKLIDRPGELAKVAKLFSKNKIDIHSVFILGKNDGHTEVAFRVDDIELAKQALR